MKPLFNLFRVANQANRISASLLNFTPQRGARYDSKIVWREPKKYKNFDMKRTWDTASFKVDPNDFYYEYQDAKELIGNDDKIKNIFSLKYQKPLLIYRHYQNELMEKVKEHPYDTSSKCVLIAKKTGTVRYFQKLLSEPPSPRTRWYRKRMELLVRKRSILIRKLREEDYKKFEWLLEVLELQYRPGIHKDCRKVNRRKAIIQLARYKVEKLKQEKLGALKKSMDEQKIPFLEKKLKKLKEIKEKEEKFNLKPTVTEEDFKACMEQMEKVKISIKENEARGYLNKVHPFLLEPFNEKLLLEREKSGELLREKLKPKEPKRYSEGTPS